MPNDNDFESPGFEYLRTFRSMELLYQKLIVLDYRKEFCARYKCPHIHKYYFSVPQKQQAEQQFIFTCLCAWLIKHKCQMNLDIDPQEYEDPDYTIATIVEAVRLLTSSDGNRGGTIGFPPGRLRQGFGPEVIWTMNILADRALELSLSSKLSRGKMEIRFHSGEAPDGSKQQAPDSITIGQPVVGGGLTTRPLGNYQMNDTSLMFDSGDDSAERDLSSGRECSETVEPATWYQQVERARPYLEKVTLVEDSADRAQEALTSHLEPLREFGRDISRFMSHQRPTLETVSQRIDQQLRVIHGRESFIQTKLEPVLRPYLEVFREYSKHKSRNDELVQQSDGKADEFESFSLSIKKINEGIKLRMRELDDGTVLQELRQVIDKLRRENDDMNVKIGLLLTVYAKIHKEVVSRKL